MLRAVSTKFTGQCKAIRATRQSQRFFATSTLTAEAAVLLPFLAPVWAAEIEANNARRNPRHVRQVHTSYSTRIIPDAHPEAPATVRDFAPSVCDKSVAPTKRDAPTPPFCAQFPAPSRSQGSSSIAYSRPGNDHNFFRRKGSGRKRTTTSSNGDERRNVQRGDLVETATMNLQRLALSASMDKTHHPIPSHMSRKLVKNIAEELVPLVIAQVLPTTPHKILEDLQFQLSRCLRCETEQSRRLVRYLTTLRAKQVSHLQTAVPLAVEIPLWQLHISSYSEAAGQRHVAYSRFTQRVAHSVRSMVDSHQLHDATALVQYLVELVAEEHVVRETWAVGALRSAMIALLTTSSRDSTTDGEQQWLLVIGLAIDGPARLAVANTRFYLAEYERQCAQAWRDRYATVPSTQKPSASILDMLKLFREALRARMMHLSREIYTTIIDCTSHTTDSHDWHNGKLTQGLLFDLSGLFLIKGHSEVAAGLLNGSSISEQSVRLLQRKWQAVLSSGAGLQRALPDLIDRSLRTDLNFSSCRPARDTGAVESYASA